MKIRGYGREEQEIEAVIDTGYTVWLSLLPALVAALGLHWQSFGRGILADDNQSELNNPEKSMARAFPTRESANLCGLPLHGRRRI